MMGVWLLDGEASQICLLTYKANFWLDTYAHMHAYHEP